MPVWSQWTLVTDLPVPFYDRPPAIAAGSSGDLYVSSSDRVLRINNEGRIVWNQRVPLDLVAGLAVDRDGGAFVAGWTTTGNFVARLDPQGALIATYPITGRPSAITIDAAGSVYITGTASEGFAATSGAYKTEFGQKRCMPPRSPTYFACSDAFVIKMRPNGVVEWATLFGGTWNDNGRAIAVDATGNVWIAGETISEDYPTTTNATQRAFGGRVVLGPLEYGDGFLAELDSAGRRLSYPILAVAASTMRLLLRR